MVDIHQEDLDEILERIRQVDPSAEVHPRCRANGEIPCIGITTIRPGFVGYAIGEHYGPVQSVFISNWSARVARLGQHMAEVARMRILTDGSTLVYFPGHVVMDHD